MQERKGIAVTADEGVYSVVVGEIVPQKKGYAVLEEAKSRKALEALAEDAVTELAALGAKEIYISSRVDGLPFEGESLSFGTLTFTRDHRIDTLELSATKKAEPKKIPGVSLLPLTRNTAQSFLSLRNECLKDLPHMDTYNLEDVVRLLHDDTYKAGFIAFSGVAGGVYELCLEDEETAKVVNLGVLPELRGKGHGKEALRTILYKAEQWGYKKASTQEASSNTPAIKLYTGVGFKPAKEGTPWYRYNGGSK